MLDEEDIIIEIPKKNSGMILVNKKQYKRLQENNQELVEFIKKIAHSNPSETTKKYIIEACDLYRKNKDKI